MIADPPTFVMSLRDVCIPSAATPVMSDQRDKRSAILVMTLGTKPIEFKTAKRTKLKTQAGSSEGDLELSSLVFVFNQMIGLTAITTGASMLTLISLTVVAISPVCLDTENPAPITCATSCIAAPRNTPIEKSSKPMKLPSIG